MRTHDMEYVTMRRRGNNFSLKVPGLAEKRPSLVLGDYIFVKHATEVSHADNRTYRVCFDSLTLFLRNYLQLTITQ